MKLSTAPGAFPAPPRPKFRPSPQQAAFLDALTGDDQHILLEARAGSGKSTTCREGAHALGDRRSIYCCFNKHIQREFEPGLPRNCRAATLHSLGLELIRRAYGDVEIESNKVYDLAESYFPSDRGKSERFVASRLVSICKNLLIDGHDDDELTRLAAIHGVRIRGHRVGEVYEAVRRLLDESREQTSVVDFDDMIWLPAMEELQFASPPGVLFVDEAQDLNPAQHVLVDLLCPDGRTVVVGDRFQSIYAFRGADSKSIPKMAARLSGHDRGLRTLPLTVTRRCPLTVVGLARRLVPDLEAMPGAIDGDVDLVEPDDWRSTVSARSLVLCRTNAPLISACLEMWRAGVPARIVGSDVGKDLLILLRSIAKSSVLETCGAIEVYRGDEMARLSKARGTEAAKAAVNDRCNCLQAIASGVETVNEIRERVQRMFVETPDDKAVAFSSVHRSKGLERDHVVILRPDLLPGPWASTSEELQQEMNILYVAVTRAKRRLTFCGDMPSPLL